MATKNSSKNGIAPILGLGTKKGSQHGQNIAMTPIETQPIETQPIETQPIETQPIETQPIETQPIETQPIETQPIETHETPRITAGIVDESKSEFIDSSILASKIVLLFANMELAPLLDVKTIAHKLGIHGESALLDLEHLLNTMPSMTKTESGKYGLNLSWANKKHAVNVEFRSTKTYENCIFNIHLASKTIAYLLRIVGANLLELKVTGSWVSHHPNLKFAQFIELEFGFKANYANRLITAYVFLQDIESFIKSEAKPANEAQLRVLYGLDFDEAARIWDSVYSKLKRQPKSNELLDAKLTFLSGNEAIAIKKSSEQSGNEQSGNEQSGNEQSGNEQSGNEQGGNEQSGNEQSGNEQSGNEQSGNEQSGNEQSGNEQSGNKPSNTKTVMSEVEKTRMVLVKKFLADLDTMLKDKEYNMVAYKVIDMGTKNTQIITTFDFNE